MSGSTDRWSTLAQDRHAHPIQALRPGTVQNVAFTTGASAPSAAFTATVSVVRIVADQDCWVQVGPAASATAADSMRLTAFDKEYIAIRAGDLVAVRGVTASGSLNITEC